MNASIDARHRRSRSRECRTEFSEARIKVCVYGRLITRPFGSPSKEERPYKQIPFLSKLLRRGCLPTFILSLSFSRNGKQINSLRRRRLILACPSEKNRRYTIYTILLRAKCKQSEEKELPILHYPIAITVPLPLVEIRPFPPPPTHLPSPPAPKWTSSGIAYRRLARVSESNRLSGEGERERE